MNENIKMNNIQELVPAEAIHPGITLQDELEAAGFTQRSLASEIGVQPSLLNEIIKGKRNITAELALLLEAALGVDASFWLNLQKNYELDVARIKEAKEKKASNVAQWQILKKFIPYKYFINQGILNGNPQQDIERALSIYKVSRIEAIQEKVNNYEPAYFRKSPKLQIDKINLNGWVHAAKFLADQQDVVSFNPNTRDFLIKELRKAISRNQDLVETVKVLLVKAGIKFLVLTKPDKTPVDGFSFWSDKNPTVVLTLRHKHLDKFAFNLFHELAHVYEHLINHPGKDFLDLNLEENEEEINSIEQQANDIASNMLVPSNAWEEFISSPNRMDDNYIISLSKQLDIHPAILVGMRCHMFGKYAWESSIPREIN